MYSGALSTYANKDDDNTINDDNDGQFMIA